MGTQNNEVGPQTPDQSLSDEFARRYFAGERLVNWLPIVVDVDSKSKELSRQKELLNASACSQTTESLKEKINALDLEIKSLKDEIYTAQSFVKVAQGAHAYAKSEGAEHGSLFESIRFHAIDMFAQNILDSAAPILALEKAQKSAILPSPRDTVASEGTQLTCRRKSFLERRKKLDTESSTLSKSDDADNPSQMTTTQIMDQGSSSNFEMGLMFGSEVNHMTNDGLSWSSIAAMFHPVSDLLCSPFDSSILVKEVSGPLHQDENDMSEKLGTNKCENSKDIPDNVLDTNRSESFEAELPPCTLPKRKAELPDWDPGFDEPEWPNDGNQHQRKLSDFSWGEFEEGACCAENRNVDKCEEFQKSDDDELRFIDEPFATSKGLRDDSSFERNNASSAREDSLGFRESISRDFSHSPLHQSAPQTKHLHHTRDRDEEAEIFLDPFHSSLKSSWHKKATSASPRSKQNFHSSDIQTGGFELACSEEIGEI